jgi:uncharacterized coiled-coil DUF342 family protein
LRICAVQKEVTQSSDEITQLKSTINALRDELDKVSVDYEQKIQTLEYNARDEIAQLHEIINKLRTTLEAGEKISKNPKAKKKGK